MSDAFIGEIRAFAFDRIPRGWIACEGQHLSIHEYQVLYGLLGNTFGGDGSSWFGLPDLRGRAILGEIIGRGHAYGIETSTLASRQTPGHTHALRCSTESANSGSPRGKLLAPVTWDRFASSWGEVNSMRPESVTQAGEGAPHENRQPYLAVNYCIALEGLYPPRP